MAKWYYGNDETKDEQSEARGWLEAALFDIQLSKVKERWWLDVLLGDSMELYKVDTPSSCAFSTHRLRNSGLTFAEMPRIHSDYTISSKPKAQALPAARTSFRERRWLTKPGGIGCFSGS